MSLWTSNGCQVTQSCRQHLCPYSSCGLNRKRMQGWDTGMGGFFLPSVIVFLCVHPAHRRDWSDRTRCVCMALGSAYFNCLSSGNDRNFLFRKKTMITSHPSFPPAFPFLKWASGVHTPICEKSYFSNIPYAFLELKPHYSVTHHPICQPATDGSNEGLQKYRRGNYLVLHQPPLQSHLTLELSFPARHVKGKGGKHCIGITD